MVHSSVKFLLELIISVDPALCCRFLPLPSSVYVSSCAGHWCDCVVSRAILLTACISIALGESAVTMRADLIDGV